MSHNKLLHQQPALTSRFGGLSQVVDHGTFTFLPRDTFPRHGGGF
jgi:hypothetical protein